MSKKSFALAAATLFTFVINVSAGTLTITSGPTFSPPVPGNTITAQVVGGELVQIFGNANISNDVLLTLEGTFFANAGDKFSDFYNFSINLTSAAPVSLTIQAFVNIGAGEQLVLNQTETVTPGNNQYSGMNEFDVPFPVSGSYRLEVTLDFPSATAIGAPNGNGSLQLSIPQNGLQFQLAPTAIPEPSTYAFLALGLGGLVAFSRRRRAV